MWVRLEFNVFGMSAKESFYNFGGPGPATFIHFAHALSERGGLGIDLEKGIVPLVSKVDLVGFKKNTMRFCAPKPADKIQGNVGRIPIPRMNVRGGIVFYVTKTMTKDILENIGSILLSMRFGGGIVKIGRRVVVADLEGLVQSYRGFFPVQKRLSLENLPQSRRETITTLENRQPDILDCLIHETSLERGKRGWKKVFLAGYRFLNEPIAREDARRMTDRDVHVFAEPVLGLIEWRSTKTAGKTPAVWRFDINEEGIRYSTFKD